MKVAFVVLLFVSLGLHGQTSENPVFPIQWEGPARDSLVGGPGWAVGSIDDYVQRNQEIPKEKIFLHLDRSAYLQGDTVWFKAYLWYGYEQRPDTTSGILYVDLVNSRGGVVRQRKLHIQGGTSRGDFVLDSAIGYGEYSLRACTRRMVEANAGEPCFRNIVIRPADQNFHIECLPVIQKHGGQDSMLLALRFFEIGSAGNLDSTIRHSVQFTLDVGDRTLQSGTIRLSNARQEIVGVGIPPGSPLDSLASMTLSIRDEELKVEKQFQVPLQESIDIQFFPEGGSLVSGLESKVAFKAIGPDGLGREVNGEIRTGSDEFVAAFSTVHKGMGTLMLQPEAGETYFAHLWFRGRKYIVPLPEPKPEGLVLSVVHPGNSQGPVLSLKQRPSGAEESKYIVGSTYGKIWFAIVARAFRDSVRLEIPVDLLPEGVCRLTVLDASFQAEGERLIYVDQSQGYHIEVIPDSSLVDTRSLIRLHIKATDRAGDPVQADLSLAALDRGQIGSRGEGPGILGYALLDSELRGTVEEPGSYFEGGKCIRPEALDVLLLTQGYRKIVPEENPGYDESHLPEKNQEITGRIELGGNASRKRKFDYKEVGLTLLCHSEDAFLMKSAPDSLGRFNFSLPTMNGTNPFFLQASSSRKKSFKGEIHLDDPLPPPHFSTFQLPEKTRTPIQEEFVHQVQSRQKSEHSKPPLPDSIAWNLSLEEVTVEAKAKDWYRRYEEDAKMIIDLDSLDPDGDRYQSLYEVLVSEYGAKWARIHISLKTVHLPATKSVYLPLPNQFSHAPRVLYFPPIYLVDGTIFWNGAGANIARLYSLEAFPVNEIKRMLVFPPMHAATNHYADPEVCGFPNYIQQSMVVIETYSKTYRGDPQGTKTFLWEGLDAPREFYSPRYEGAFRHRPQYDGRVTLYWNPSIRTDSNGTAEVSFYSSDRPTDVQIVVNGMDIESGFPGEGRAQVEVTQDESPSP